MGDATSGRRIVSPTLRHAAHDLKRVVLLDLRYSVPKMPKNAGVVCDDTEAQSLAMMMNKMQNECDNKCAFMQQHFHHKGIKIFGE